MRDLPNLALELRPSRTLFIGMMLLHLLAAGAVSLSGVPTASKALLLALLGLSLLLASLRNGLGDDRHCIVCMELIDGRWRLETASGTHLHAHLVSGYAHPLLIILHFGLEKGRRRSLTLLSDSADADALRRLRVWLRMQRASEEGITG